ncbi:efflux RND transporter periplasmic adaptor subunit [Corticibacterium sp. UT-5YL-CI-8]|nr:efflux RND transporter periplasmic adaptor subunit [Tianweitania sp. UT-5YL-CI-8]
MSKFRFHQVAAVAVLVAFAVWMGTGKFSSVGSAQPAADATPVAAEQPQAPARTVAVLQPPRTEHARTIRISGLTEANKRAVLATRANGVIAQLPAQEGDHVKEGDLVLMLDAEEKTAAVDNAKALLEQRKAEWEATQQLLKSGNLARLQADSSRSAFAAAQAQVEAAEAELARNQVKAPFAGLIDRVDVEIGSSVMQGGEVATILNLDPILAKGEVSERDLQYLKIGETAEVNLVNGEKVNGSLSYISRDASAQTRTFRVEISIPNPDLKIPAGMTAEIALKAEATDAVMLPRSVVTLSANGDLGVRAVDKDNKVVFYPIDLVDDTPTALVLAGIPAETRIIVAGQELTTEGQTVNPVQADEATIKKLIGEATGATQ